MKARFALMLAVASATCTIASVSAAATCFYDPGFLGSRSFDSVIFPTWNCQQSFIDSYWSRYDFDHDDWDQGFGFDAPCDQNQPLARTFNGITALAYSGTNSPSCDSGQANVLLWAECYSANSIDELDGRCGSGSAGSGARAYTKFGPIIDNYTELYWPFFYGEDIVQRASTLFHEARHAQGWCQHSSDSSCPRGSSCDPSYNGGCQGFGSSSGKGANGFQIDYLSWYANAAVSWRTNAALKQSAVDTANDMLARSFATNPCLFMLSNGVLVSCR